MDMNWCCLGAALSGEKDLPDSEEQLQIDLQSLKNIRLFSYNQLTKATSNFHPSRRLGRGGFGVVYQGILKNGTHIAAKVLSEKSSQGSAQFLNEIDIIANIRHPNLVELIGCCIERNTRILVYEYMKNNSLDRTLRDLQRQNIKLNWDIRSSICVGAAKGLAFLHEELESPIVHRDIKASNILLDNNFSAKIGDFGLARLFPDSVTHISTRVAGTAGYLAPEYALQGQLTKKADVYSFGVVALEVISGKSISKTYWFETDISLVSEAWKLYEEARMIELVDPNLEDYPKEEVIRYIKVALFCTQAAAARRPSMSQVVNMLSESMQLNDVALTPPRVYQSPARTIGGWEGAKPIISGFKASEGTTSSSPASSVPVTYSEVIPR